MLRLDSAEMLVYTATQSLLDKDIQNTVIANMKEKGHGHYVNYARGMRSLTEIIDYEAVGQDVTLLRPRRRMAAS